MTDAPRDRDTPWSPLEDDDVEDEAMDEVLNSYTEAIEAKEDEQEPGPREKDSDPE
ncbi:hypothetical protein V2S66_33380 [Streptomyces sp. V4-01]|uniref:Uncharacterized protein n=1 Tax=Actinacidiphila polyblastidii TaxID=3110430 RepID=A0ABU7PLY3_9ACTN|nr:hypothetical protein [Streptomyces sp. V4-01]